jgi:hypothetical protein
LERIKRKAERRRERWEGKNRVRRKEDERWRDGGKRDKRDEGRGAIPACQRRGRGVQTGEEEPRSERRKLAARI